MERTLPLDPYTLTPVDRDWRNRGVGVKGDAVRHEAFTQSMEEILYVIEQAGITPDGEDLTQLYQALRRIAARVAFGPVTIVKLTTPGAATWTVPAGVYSILVRMWGAGGGGGRGNGGAPSGGASGEFVERQVTVVPGQVISANVGTGGLGGSTSPVRQGQPGTASSITAAGVTVTAGGGNGGVNAATGDTGASPSAATGTGTADVRVPGSPGGYGIGGYINGSGYLIGGNGGAAPLGGATVPGGVSTPFPGAAPGGGGGSTSSTGFDGAQGARGEIQIIYATL